jgi:hypothetical protein
MVKKYLGIPQATNAKKTPSHCETLPETMFLQQADNIC